MSRITTKHARDTRPNGDIANGGNGAKLTMKIYPVRLPRELIEKLSIIARAEDRPVSYIMRRILRQGVERSRQASAREHGY